MLLRSALSTRHHCCLHVVFLIYLFTLLGSLPFHCLYFILLQFLGLLSQVHAAKGTSFCYTRLKLVRGRDGFHIVLVYSSLSTQFQMSLFLLLHVHLLSFQLPPMQMYSDFKPIAICKGNSFPWTFFYTSKDVYSFQRRFRFTAKLSRSTEMFQISLATTHAYPPPFSIYVFSIFHNCVRTDFRVCSMRLQPVQSL